MRVYVASSWRNEHQPAVVTALRKLGLDVFDFREHPQPTPPWGKMGYGPDAGRHWTHDEIRRAFNDPRVLDVFKRDMGALRHAEVTVLVCPSGRSAHLEAGFATGAGQKLVAFTPEGVEPEIMTMMADHIVTSIDDLCAWFEAEKALRQSGSPPAASPPEHA